MHEALQNYSHDGVVDYHYGAFPPRDIDTAHLFRVFGQASSALARYDQVLKILPNAEILLAPLRNQEAVISSRIEGTVSTVDEILRIEADIAIGEETSHFRHDVYETLLYQRALKAGQKAIEGGQPVSDWLIRSLHHELLNFGRGAHKSPGQYKTEQNYLVDPIKKRILFTPIKPERLRDGLDQLFLFSANDAHAPLLRSAIAHVEFEALHPFEDGNGRVGRMLITLGLWKDNLISKPYFYISRFFENNKDEYIDRMRMVSEKNDWTQWCEFFLTGVETQAISNLDLAEKIQDLYQQTQIVFSEALASKWSFQALDFIYAHPIFRTTQLVRDTDVAPATARRFINILLEKQQLVCLVPPSGRRAGLYGFEPLLKLVRV